MIAGVFRVTCIAITMPALKSPRLACLPWRFFATFKTLLALMTMMFGGHFASYAHEAGEA